MNYQQLIESTIVPERLSFEEKIECYKPIIQIVDKMLPPKLYRFRNCSERHISAFWKDELWFSNGSSMNDDFDARLYYDKKKIDEYLNSLISKDRCLEVLNQFIAMDKIPTFIESIVPNAEYVLNQIKNMSQEQMTLVSVDFVNYIKNNRDDSLKNITSRVQALTKFACFSENIDSDMMWGHYANSSSGFAIEYDFTNRDIRYMDESGNKSTIYCDLYPIIYDNQRLDTTEYAMYLFKLDLLFQVVQLCGMPYIYQYASIIFPCPDEFMGTKLALKKSSEWKSEKEWRMFYKTNNQFLSTQQHSFVKQKPSAVYLGRKISNLNQKIIIDMAKEKNIPVFKMNFYDDIKTYRLDKYKME
ncbi:MAG: DUF2971 domain-containing protein [Selenomonadaceae bacterium]|nr:DUF2971 domain-containing protein [Selenomonadaceae bacterium]